MAGQETKTAPTQKKSPAATKTTKSADTGDLNRDTTFSLLREAYNISRDLTSEQRIPLLVQICQISASMNSKTAEPRLVVRAAGGHMQTRTERTVPRDLTRKQRDKLRDWSEELFQLGDEFPSGSQLRLQAETAAARAMISVNPKRAVELLDAIDTTPDRGGWDPRLSVVSALFNELYAREGAAAIPDIRREALSLGDRGVYPYYAVLNLLNQVHDNRDVVRQFFADSVDYLRRGPASRQEIFGMVSLLSSDQIRKQVEDWQTQDAATQLVSQVKEYMHAQSESQGDESVGVRGLLMVVKNSLKRFAPDAVASLPDPANLGFNGSPYFMSVNANTRRKIPEPSVPDESMQQLKAAFEASRTAMMKLNENDIHEGPQMQQTIGRTVELGAELAQQTIQSYAPEDHAYAMLVSSSELSGVARLGAHINPAATLAAIRGVQDDELKTRLLLAVARTIEYLH
ncbi:MAG: hypothetical protein ROO76_12790 [Terriglobia bacterium]|jgi:hypothetical protein|nr:hypothetical protein [Terriglobia bacterium]